MRSPKWFLPIFLLMFGLGPAAVPAVAGAEAPASTPVLAFAGDSAHIVGGQVAVPVECEGTPSGFCSGTVTLTRGGQRASAPFAVRGGADETLYVPFRLEVSGRPTKVSATLSTALPLGGPIGTKTLLFVR
jgi:hypothetical protein